MRNLTRRIEAGGAMSALLVVVSTLVCLLAAGSAHGSPTGASLGMGFRILVRYGRCLGLSNANSDHARGDDDKR